MMSFACRFQKLLPVYAGIAAGAAVAFFVFYQLIILSAYPFVNAAMVAVAALVFAVGSIRIVREMAEKFSVPSHYEEEQETFGYQVNKSSDAPAWAIAVFAMIVIINHWFADVSSVAALFLSILYAYVQLSGLGRHRHNRRHRNVVEKHDVEN